MVETLKIGAILWHNLTNPTIEDLDFLRINFKFHPLDIDDCSSFVQRPKIDIYDDYYFMVLHFPYIDSKINIIRTEETKIFWGKNFIITVINSGSVVHDLFNLVKVDPKEVEEDEISGTSDVILYKALSRMMKETFLLVDKMGTEIDTINRELFEAKPEKIIEKISRMRKNLIQLNTMIKPQLRLFHKFESGETKGFAENMEDYWGNILDFYQKMWDMIDDYQELIAGLSNTFDSLQANKTNEIMRMLTIISTIVLPLTFITGLYGMNVSLPLEHNPLAFLTIAAGCVIILIIMLLWFMRKKWM